MTPTCRLQRALERGIDESERDIEVMLDHLVAAQALRGNVADAQREIARLVSRVKALGALSGRMSVRFGATAAPEPEDFAARDSSDLFGAVPEIAFDAAVEDLRSRDPYAAHFLRDMKVQVWELYGPTDDGQGGVVYPHGIAAARAATEEAAAKLQAALVEGMRLGFPTEDVARRLAREQDWTKAYSRMVCRTNFNAATTAGRFTEAKAVHDSGIPIALEFQATMDSSTRPGHAAMNGIVAMVDDPIWDSWSPPLAENCRCVLAPLVGKRVRRAKVPPGAEKKQGFGSRPDRRSY